MRWESTFLWAALITALTLKPTAGATRYNVTDLGILPGYNVSHAYSINNNGQITGYVADFNLGGSTYLRAVLFDPNGTGNNIDLGTLGGENSAALSINNSGQIVGGAESDLDSSIEYVTIFDPNGTGNNTTLNAEGGAWQNNDNGQIVGFVLIDSPAGHTHRAALFEPSSEPNMINLGTLPGYPQSKALSINNEGFIVGTSYNPNLEYPYADARAVLFDPTGDGNNIDLGSLPGYVSALAFSTNNNGQIVGRANNLDMSVFNWNPRAVLFDPTGDGNNIDLGTLPGCDSAEAFSINNKGQIVGRAISESYTDYAVLFDSTGGGNNVNLNDLINPALGWRLFLAISINDSGWIVGWGYNRNHPIGDQNSFLLIPATPGDLEPDGDVDFADFAALASAWQSRDGDGNWNSFCDISEPNDGVIDEHDLAVFFNNWLLDIP